MYYAEDPALLARVSVSSDAFGSWPVFDEHGRLTSYEARAPLQPARLLVLVDARPLAVCWLADFRSKIHGRRTCRRTEEVAAHMRAASPLWASSSVDMPTRTL